MLRTIERRDIGILCLVLLAGFLLGWFVMERVAPRSSIITDQGIRQNGKYQLISPLLVCSTAEEKDFGPYKSLESKINNLISSSIANGKASSVSVYFRDLRGKWVGINDNVPYAPASLLKVPLMIAYFKLADNDPKILQKRLVYDGSSDANQMEVFKSPNLLKPGTYTVSELLKAMIGASDNNAMALLYENIDPEHLAEVFTDLGLQVPAVQNGVAQTITAKEYAYFFRILYNGTYLSPEYSEKALELLSISDFPQGLPSAVPKDITVAHKFGERSVVASDGTLVERELHDCGIVYVPDKPYLLCVMTQGKDFNDLTSVIQKIGKIVYSEIDQKG